MRNPITLKTVTDSDALPIQYSLDYLNMEEEMQGVAYCIYDQTNGSKARGKCRFFLVDASELIGSTSSGTTALEFISLDVVGDSFLLFPVCFIGIQKSTGH